MINIQQAATAMNLHLYKVFTVAMVGHPAQLAMLEAVMTFVTKELRKHNIEIFGSSKQLAISLVALATLAIYLCYHFSGIGE